MSARSKKLQKAWADGDVGALIETLLAALEAPRTPDARIGVERWALEAALLYVCHVAGIRVDGSPLPIPLPKRGRGGLWASGFPDEIRDLIIYRQVTDACEGGMLIGKALAHVAKREQAEGAVRKAYGRARDRLTQDPQRYEFWERFLPAIDRVFGTKPGN